MYGRRIPEDRIEGKPLGRHVLHDPLSRNYPVLAPRAVTPTSKTWRRYSPILNQGNLGCCVPNSGVGTLGTAPFYGKLLTQRRAGLTLDEPYALDLYRAVTAIDPWPGQWEPDDTGSDGLSLAKVLKSRGLIREYRHIFSMNDAYAAILTSPFVIGINWYSGMDQPNSKGLVTVSGTIRGGHEIEVLGYSARYNLWKLANSWGTDWAASGYFYLTSADLERLLAEEGDATVLVA